jgi:hypothetical protein
MSLIDPKHVQLNMRTADQTRRASLQIEREKTAAELMQSAVDHWNLPRDHDYTLVNISTSRLIPADAVLSKEWVGDSDIVEIQPVLLAGGLCA